MEAQSLDSLVNQFVDAITNGQTGIAIGVGVMLVVAVIGIVLKKRKDAAAKASQEEPH